MEELSTLTPEQLAATVKDLYGKSGPLCDSEGFYNHMGECWNDALQMIFLNSDVLKEKVQGSLASEEIDANKVEDIFRPFIEESVELYVSQLKKNETLNQARQYELVRRYISFIYTYLVTVQKRFQRHYYAEHLRLDLADRICGLEERKGVNAIKQLKEISLLQRAKGREGILGALVGQEFERYAESQLKETKPLQNIYEPGGRPEGRDNVYVIFQQYFDLPVSQTLFKVKTISMFKRLYQTAGGKPFSVDKGTIAVYLGMVSLYEQNAGHATCFYTCGGRDFYFDDNVGTIQFPWRTFLNHLTDKKTAEMIAGEETYTESKLNADDIEVSWEVFFDGILTITNQVGTVLFKTKYYPILRRTHFESVKPTTMQPDYFLMTYLWDGTLIKKIQSRKARTNTQHTQTIKGENGEVLNISFEFGVPQKNILNLMMRYDAIGEIAYVPGVKNQKTGAILGTRLRATNTKLIEVLLEKQIAKISKGEAKIDDFFYEHENGVKETPLTYAVYHNKPEYVEILLENGADPNKKNSDLESPLFMAVSEDKPNETILNLLINKKANINDDTNARGGFTPLIGCIISMDEEPNLRTVEFLLEHGADVTIASKRTDTLPIEYALVMGQLPVVELLKSYGAAPPTCPTKEELTKVVDQNTKLMTLIRNRKVVKATLLARCYRDFEMFDAINYENKLGETALNLAIKYAPDDELIAALFRNGAEIDYIDKNGLTPIYYAIQQGNIQAIEELKKYQPDYRLTVPALGPVLTYATKLGRDDIVEVLEPSVTGYIHRLERKGKPTGQIPIVRKVTKTLAPNKKTNYTFKLRPIKKATPSAFLNSERRRGRKTRKY